MSIIQGNAKQASTRGFYSFPIEQSLRFNDDDSAYLSWTPDSAGNRKTWTWSGWFKRANLSDAVGDFLFYENPTGGAGADHCFIYLKPDNALRIGTNASSSVTSDITTSMVFRDVSSWYHLVVQFDTTQATDTDRIKVYVNGTRITAFSSATWPTQNTDLNFNTANPHYIGYYSPSPASFDGYLAEVNFIDGTALDADSFGELKNGVWIPKDPSGLTYGTNGFRLKFDVELPSFTGDYLVVGGGGGGGRGGGGGGGGGFRELTSQTLYKTFAYPIVVGDGGAGASDYSLDASNGEDSTFVITSAGGGGGGSHLSGTAASGGSGGGGGSSGGANAGGSGNTPSTSPSQGNNGGTSSGSASAYGAGGGGGASAVGANGTSTSGGNGGSGSTSTIDGNTYAAGGGGTGRALTAGLGGSSIGGDAGADLENGGDAVASTGSGGGGCGFDAGGNQGGSGSDGIILIKIPDSVTATFSGGVTQTSSTAGGYTTYTVTATSGSETVEFS